MIALMAEEEKKREQRLSAPIHVLNAPEEASSGDTGEKALWLWIGGRRTSRHERCFLVGFW